MKKISLLLVCLAMIFASCDKNGKKGGNAEGSVAYQRDLTEEEIQNGILTPEVLWKFGRLGDMQVSPDGKTVLYTVTYYSVETNGSNTQIYSIPVEGGEATRLTNDESISCFNPRWTKDGNIAYLSTDGDAVQVWTMSADGKDNKKISNLAFDVNSFKISPAGDKIMLIADVKMDETPAEIYPDLPNTNCIIATDLMYRHWNDWHDYKYSHIFVADFNDNITNAADIMEGEKFDSPLSPYFDDAEIAWSNDGKCIAYTCKKLSGKDYAVSTNSDIYLYNLEDGTVKNLTEGMMGYDKYPVFSADSKKLAWISMETPGYESDKERLFVMDLESGEKKYVTEKWDYGCSNVVWDNENADKLYFTTVLNATFQIFSVDLNTCEINQLTKGQHDFTGLAACGNDLLASKTSMSMATELFVVDKNGQERQLTNVNKNIYDKIEMGRVEERWVTTTDNKQMLTWVIYPPKFDSTKVYPAILYCEGGPQSPVSQFWSYRWNFQIMAANGYIVIAPNRRGLPGFGTEWNAQISGDYGGQNMKDYVSAVNAIKTEPYIDEDHIGAVGASYGGFSVYWLAGHNQDSLFKAFIAHCGMFNLESQYASTEEMFFVNHDLGGPYWEKDNATAQKSYETSPHHFVQNWNAPILIFTGGKDFRIPYTESLQAFNMAQMRGIESKLVVFPEETHFVLKPQNSILWQREFKAWLDQHLKK